MRQTCASRTLTSSAPGHFGWVRGLFPGEIKLLGHELGMPGEKIREFLTLNSTPSLSAHTTLPHRQDIRGPSLRNCVSKKRELKILITGKIICPNAEFSISSLVLYS